VYAQIANKLMRIRGTLVVSAALLVITLLAFAIALGRDITSTELDKALRQHPEVLVEAIKSNRIAIIEIINQATLEEQARAQSASDDAEKAALEESFNNPRNPLIDAKTRVRGLRNARYTLVEYADFECPYCASGYQTVEELRNKYGADLRFVFKHLPLQFHPQAMPAAQWIEAIAIQSPEKAWKFHDVLFKNQDKLGLEFFRRTAASMGVDAKRCEKDAQSQAVKDRIAADMDEAKSFGFEGTPGFLLNGIPVVGAKPAAYFEEIIARLVAAKAK
jgi:protein-disulfide isomerase